MRSNRLSAAATARKSHARALRARDRKTWRAHATRKRAICEPLRPRTADSTASLCNVLQTPHNDVVEST
eukprot:9121087-Lingulodinium_polyedra.AAC.1